MRNNILSLNFSKLRKIEVQYFADSVIRIVEKHDPETLNIKELFDILVEQTPQIELLKLRYGPHPATHELEALRTKRNAYAQGIVNHVRTIERAKDHDLIKSIVLTKPIVLIHMQELSRFTEKETRQQLNQFFRLMNENPKLYAAIETLDLINQVDNLKVVCSSIDMHYDERRGDVSGRPKKKTPVIVSELKKNLLDLFKQIEVAQIKHKELDYTALIDELNKEITGIKSDLSIRASYNKKRAEKASNEANDVETHSTAVVMSLPEEPSASTQSTERMYPTNVEVDNNEDNLEQLDIKKTVAVSGKQTRLPIVSDEA